MDTSQQYPEIWEGNIQKQLWHLRYEDPTQYQALVKMHLSFATDIPLDECDGRSFKQSSGRKWQLTPLIRRLGRTTVSTKGVMEGAPLTQEGVCQAFHLIHFLNKEYNISQEGLFRKTGSFSRQQELKNLLNSGGDLNLDSGSHSAHDCASVLKSFLADLPEPLLTEGHYSIHCRVAEMLQSHMCQEQKDMVYFRQIKALRLLFLLLPPENYQLLQDLLILLNRVAANQKQNLMTALNLGTMFAPHILCSRKMTANDMQYLSGTLSTAVAFMIENASQLFQVPLELEYDVLQYWNNKKKLKHQLSKRSLMDAPTNTIFTFIDRELTAQANDKDVTEVALAELYAYVQSLPDSAKKRRLIKKFNHASGLGTPQLNNSISKKQEAQGRTLGDSIKKHLFYKGVKSSKSKSQPISSSVNSVGVKRTNSEDLLSSTSKKSPELRRFHSNPESDGNGQLRTKSLDDLSSLISEYSSPAASMSDHLTCSSIIHPAYNPRSSHQNRRKTPLPITVPQRHNSECSSISDSESSGSLASPLPFTPLPVNSSFDSQGSRGSECGELTNSTLNNTTREYNSFAFNFPNSMLDETKENAIPLNTMLHSTLHSTPSGSMMEVHSPISEAMMRSSIPEKVIMTPRSRCPIIVNSATNLANTAIPEERESFIYSTTLEQSLNRDNDNQDNDYSPVITNPVALLSSPEKTIEHFGDVASCHRDGTKYGKSNTSRSKERTDHGDSGIKHSTWKSSTLRRTLSSASSTGSLFGTFFHHLSTSSLGQLATRLTSSSSVSSVTSNLSEGEEEDPAHDLSVCKGDDDMNESLSSVFRDYLLSRSILTDNPVDLSVQYLDTEEKNEGGLKGKSDLSEDKSACTDEPNIVTSSAQESVHSNLEPCNESMEQQCGTPSAASYDSAVGLSPNVSLSDSLLFCLDGNNPVSPTNPGDLQSINDGAYKRCLETPSMQEQDICHSHSIDLHSCNPESRRQSILKTKQGTPIPQRDKDSTNSLSGTKGVIFETSF